MIHLVTCYILFNPTWSYETCRFEYITLKNKSKDIICDTQIRLWAGQLRKHGSTTCRGNACGPDLQTSTQPPYKLQWTSFFKKLLEFRNSKCEETLATPCLAWPWHVCIATRQDASIADSGSRSMQPSEVLTCTQQPRWLVAIVTL